MKWANNTYDGFVECDWIGTRFSRWLAMRHWRLVLLSIGFLLGVSASIHAQELRGKPVTEHGIQKFVFPLRGPLQKTTVAPEGYTSWREYSEGSPSRLAVLLTDTNSNWLGIVRGLKSIGIPFCITLSPNEALRHRVVLSYPGFPSTANADSVRAFVQSGSTFFSIDLTNDANAALFGFSHAAASQARTTIHFSDAIAAQAALTEPVERTIPFASKLDPTLSHWSTSYTLTSANGAATYDDGSCAMTSRTIGSGHIYALGIDLGYLLELGYNGRQTEISRSYANAFEPALDVPLRIIKAIYEEGEPNAVTLWPAPEGKSLSVLLTHDIDYDTSVRNSSGYATLELQNGITATYFMQTKYMTDYEDRSFLDDSAAIALRALSAMGMEIGSHSVSHSRQFSKFPMGSGMEMYPDYTPFVRNVDTTLNGTILGELRASKYVLVQLIGQPIVSFRPGYLSNPIQLPEALEATGYSYSSSVTANSAMTHLPYQLSYSREGKELLPEFSFPITIEDGEKPPMDQRLDKAIALAHSISKYGGCCCILIHPNIFGYKYRFEKGFIPSVKDFSWFGTIKKFGEFWSARNELQLDVTSGGTKKEIVLNAPDEISGLTLSVPSGWKFESSTPADLKIDAQSGRIVIERLAGNATLVFTAK